MGGLPGPCREWWGGLWAQGGQPFCILSNAQWWSAGFGHSAWPLKQVACAKINTNYGELCYFWGSVNEEEGRKLALWPKVVFLFLFFLFFSFLNFIIIIL